MCQYPEFTMDICQLCPTNITQTFSSTCVIRNIQIFQARFCRGWLGGGLCQHIARLTDFVRCCGNNWLPILASSLSTWFFNYSSSEFHHLRQRSLLWDAILKSWCWAISDLEFVKSFTLIRFQNLSILPKKNA